MSRLRGSYGRAWVFSLSASGQCHHGSFLLRVNTGLSDLVDPQRGIAKVRLGSSFSESTSGNRSLLQGCGNALRTQEDFEVFDLRRLPFDHSLQIGRELSLLGCV